MELTDLKKIRTWYPGVYSVVLVFIYLWAREGKSLCDVFSSSDFSLSGEMVLPVLGILLVAVLYYAFDLRNIIWKPAMKKVGDNINKRMLEIADVDLPFELTKEQKRSIKSSVFYKLIDNDESLTTKSKNVMHNGSILSCVADTIIISPIYLAIVLISAICSKSALTWSFYLGLVLLAFAIPTFFRLLNKHIALSNEQLDFIKDNYSEKCKDEISKIVKNGNRNTKKVD